MASQEASRIRLKKIHPNWDSYLKAWEPFYGKPELLIVNLSENSIDDDTRYIENKNVPSFSICIPTYNRARYIADAIQSTLNQGFGDFEIVVIDDGSTDETEEVVKSFKNKNINYIKIEHSGAPVARNKALELARGVFIVWLDSDDVLEIDSLIAYSEVLKSNPAADVIYGDLLVTDNFLNPQWRIEYDDWKGKREILVSRFLYECPIPHAGTLMRKSCYYVAGNYDI